MHVAKKIQNHMLIDNHRILLSMLIPCRFIKKIAKKWLFGRAINWKGKTLCTENPRVRNIGNRQPSEIKQQQKLVAPSSCSVIVDGREYTREDNSQRWRSCLAPSVAVHHSLQGKSLIAEYLSVCQVFFHRNLTNKVCLVSCREH
jgi:hypothetical protein